MILPVLGGAIPASGACTEAREEDGEWMEPLTEYAEEILGVKLLCSAGGGWQW